MKSRLTSIAAALAFVLAGTTACNKANKDPEIQSTLNAKSQTDPNLASVTTLVNEGTVTLIGTCADEDCRTNAEKTVKEIDGVDKVINNITVAPATATNDETIRGALADIVKKYESVQADVSNGVITLRGTIKNREKLQDLVMELGALRPKRIDNQLVIDK